MKEPDNTKEITLRVPQEKYDFVMGLIKELGLEVTQEIDIPEWHKQIVEERIAEYKRNPDSMIPWNEARKKLRFREE